MTARETAWGAWCASCGRELTPHTAGWLDGDLVCWPRCPGADQDSDRRSARAALAGDSVDHVTQDKGQPVSKPQAAAQGAVLVQLTADDAYTLLTGRGPRRRRRAMAALVDALAAWGAA